MADPLPTLPSAADRAVQIPANVLDPNYYLFLRLLLNAVADLRARSELVALAGSATTADVPEGQFRVIKNTTGPTYSLVVNDGGVLKSVALT